MPVDELGREVEEIRIPGLLVASCEDVSGQQHRTHGAGAVLVQEPAGGMRAEDIDQDGQVRGLAAIRILQPQQQRSDEPDRDLWS